VQALVLFLPHSLCLGSGYRLVMAMALIPSCGVLLRLHTVVLYTVHSVIMCSFSPQMRGFILL